MSDAVIRSACAKDAPEIYALLCEIASIHKNGRKDLYSDFESKYAIDEVETRIAACESGVFVAECGSVVAGYVFCEVRTHETEPQMQSIKTLYVDDLCVRSDCRRKGIASALLDKARDYGREKECYHLILNVWEFNRDAVAFYEKYGLRTSSRHMEMIL